MTKIFKGLLLLSIFAFIISCQAKTTDSDFEVVDENVSLTPEFVKPPVDEDIPPTVPGGTIPSIPPLNETELSIGNAEAFNLDVTKRNLIISMPIDFKIKDGERITKTIFLNTQQTEVLANVVITERSKGSVLEKLKSGIKIIKTSNHELNTYSIVENTTILQEALPKVGTYAKFSVDVYVRDLRKYDADDNNKKKYSVTKRSFEFTVKRTE